MKNPLLDEDFLKHLVNYKHHHTWAKIVALNFDEYPLQEIQGQIISGNINIDGASALRRTCSLSIATNDVNINEFYWGLKTKFYVYIGLENFIDTQYPEIIWFKQGMFVITSFNATVGVNNYTINIQGKDKMVLLNGDLGGIIPASWDFATEDINATDENGNTIYDSSGYAVIERRQKPIKEIITESVHEFSQEPFENIIINDLDDYGIELLEYQGKVPFYYIIEYDSASGVGSREISNMTINGNMLCYVRLDSWDESKQERKIGDWAETQRAISKLEEIEEHGPNSNKGVLCYEKLIEGLDPSGEATENKDYLPVVISFTPNHERLFTVAKISANSSYQVCGYRICDIIYPYDLILAPGSTITSMLDSLVKMLGNFEYFYDVDGRFVFQKKKTFIDVSYNNIVNEHTISDEVWADSGEYSSKYSYTFENNELLSSIQNAPNLSNLKNDYSLWGARKNGNVTVPVHMRYAIDHKPLYYKVIGHIIWKNSDGKPIAADGTILQDNDSSKYVFTDALQGYITMRGAELYPELAIGAKVVDWREIIYQMANDYRRHYHDIDFLERVRDNNKYNQYDSFYPKGRTGYEQYYIDFEMNLSQGVVAYWRELYNLEAKDKTGRYLSSGEFVDVKDECEKWESTHSYTNDNKNYKGYIKGARVFFPYDENGNKTEKTKYWKSLKNENEDEIIVYKKDENGNIIFENDEPVIEKYSKNWTEILSSFTYNREGWNINLLNNPESLNFWFDFLDTTGELNKYGVNNIGLRSKATNDDKIKAIYFREVPNVIFEANDKVTRTASWTKPGYCHVHIPDDYMGYFTISSRGKSMIDVLDEYLYAYTYPASAITLTSIPIYHLTPNTLIYINDKQTGIVGEYIMQKFSLQLGLSATMSINAVETAKRIY